MVNKSTVFKWIMAAILVSACIPLDSIDIYLGAWKNSMEIDAHYFWFNSIIFAGTFGTFFIGALVSYPLSDLFCREYKGGFWRYTAQRLGKRRYVLSGTLKCFAAGATSALAGGILFLVGCRFLLQSPLFDTHRFVEIEFLPFAGILNENPTLYFALALYLLAVSCGMWAVVGYCFSFYVPENYLIYILPFVISFMVTRVCQTLGVPQSLRPDFILRGRAGPKGDITCLAAATLIVAAVCTFSACAAYRKLKWRLENE